MMDRRGTGKLLLWLTGSGLGSSQSTMVPPVPCVFWRKWSRRHGADPGQAKGREEATSTVGWDPDCLTGRLPGMDPTLMGLGTVFLPLDLHGESCLPHSVQLTFSYPLV